MNLRFSIIFCYSYYFSVTYIMSNEWKIWKNFVPKSWPENIYSFGEIPASSHYYSFSNSTNFFCSKLRTEFSAFRSTNSWLNIINLNPHYTFIQWTIIKSSENVSSYFKASKSLRLCENKGLLSFLLSFNTALLNRQHLYSWGTKSFVSMIPVRNSFKQASLHAYCFRQKI